MSQNTSSVSAVENKLVLEELLADAGYKNAPKEHKLIYTQGQKRVHHRRHQAAAQTARRHRAWIGHCKKEHRMGPNFLSTARETVTTLSSPLPDTTSAAFCPG
jgi:hypothetical protein